MYKLWIIILLVWKPVNGAQERWKVPYPFYETEFQQRYSRISDEEREIAKDQVKEMFWFGFKNYMKHAFPLDELDPIHCTGRGPDYAHP